MGKGVSANGKGGCVEMRGTKMYHRMVILGIFLGITTLVWADGIRLWAGTETHARRVTLTPFLASAEENTGKAVIVLPGGSYSWLDKETEGVEVAQWLQRHGINAFVLHYRVANVSAYIFWYRALGVGNKYPDMVDDVAKALEYVYTHAREYQIDTMQIGTMGFSAGGHLALSAFVYNQTAYKPKFVCMGYPVVTMSHAEYTHKRSRRAALGVYGQYDRRMRDSLSLEKHVPLDCPPVFLFNCKDDPVVRYENSLLMDSALTARNVEHRYVQYERGGHGFGGSEVKGSAEARRWKDAFLEWLSQW